MTMENWNRSLKLLSEGNYEEGWPRHEWIRTGSPDHKDCFHPTPNFGKSIWDGETEPIHLLINADFGMGDTIHFWRFVDEVKRRVSKVTLRCDEDFKDLFVGVNLISKDDPIPEVDKVIHMMALPRVLGIRELSGKPYLQPNEDFFLHQSLYSFGSLKFTKIGVCWSGNPFNPQDFWRSIPAEEFLKIPHKLFSLNKLEGPIGFNILDMRGFLTDWNSTAHLVKKLDLVITVDTAVAHLAGAMGVPVWLLVSNEPDWRWGKTGESTVWYESMRIFRKTGAWSELMDKIVTELVDDGGKAP